MLASTIQFTTNPPTPGSHHPHKAAEHRSGNQGALPQNPDSMPPPHTKGTRGHPPPADHHNHKAAAAHHSGRVSYTKHQTSQPHPREQTHETQSTAQPSARQAPQPAQTQQTAQTTHDQEATPTQIPILRKEVIQPHLPVRLPCYDFVPITSPTFDRSP